MQIHFYILASGFENTNIFTKIIVNESYGILYENDILAIFYHPNVTLDTINACSMENSSDHDFPIFMRAATNSDNVQLYDYAITYSSFLIFDGFGTNMTYRGS